MVSEILRLPRNFIPHTMDSCHAIRTLSSLEAALTLQFAKTCNTTRLKRSACQAKWRCTSKQPMRVPQQMPVIHWKHSTRFDTCWNVRKWHACHMKDMKGRCATFAAASLRIVREWRPWPWPFASGFHQRYGLHVSRWTNNEGSHGWKLNLVQLSPSGLAWQSKNWAIWIHLNPFDRCFLFTKWWCVFAMRNRWPANPATAGTPVVGTSDPLVYPLVMTKFSILM